MKFPQSSPLPFFDTDDLSPKIAEALVYQNTRSNLQGNAVIEMKSPMHPDSARGSSEALERGLGGHHAAAFQSPPSEFRSPRESIRSKLRIIPKKAKTDHFGYEFCIAVKDYRKYLEKLQKDENEMTMEMKAKCTEQAREYENTLKYLLKDIKSTLPNATVIRTTEENMNVLFILIGVSNGDLCAVADRTKPWLKFNNVHAHARGYKLDLDLAAHFDSTEGVWHDLFGPFENNFLHLFETYHELRPDGQGRYPTKFRQVDRLSIIDYVVNDEDLINGLNLDERYGLIFETSFPLINEPQRDELLRVWRSYTIPSFKHLLCCGGGVFPFSQPVDKIEAYLGQKIALYFEFLRLHTLFLIPSGLIGLVVFLYQLQSGGVDNLVTSAYSLFVVFNFMAFCRCNEQNQNILAAKWGSTKLLEEERTRPDYRGEVQWSEIDGGMQIKLPPGQKLIRRLVATLAIVATVIFIYGSLAGGFYAETILEGTLFSGTIFAVMLTLVNTLTRVLSYMLTNVENPKTITEYNGALIKKLTLFKFMTGFGLLYYSAFLEEQISGSCGSSSCAQKTADLLRGTFIGMIVINNLLEIGLPSLLLAYSKCMAYLSGSEEDELSEIEAQFHSADHGGTLDEYDEIISQIGFTTFFVPFFPIAPLLAIINNLIEVNIDSTKTLCISRRPMPEKASSSGQWNYVLSVFSYIMLVTNAASIIFRFKSTSEFIGISSLQEKFFAFFIIIMGMLLMQTLFLDMLIPKLPKKIEDHLARQDHVWPYLLGIKSKNDDIEFSYEFNMKQVTQQILGCRGLDEKKKGHRLICEIEI
eukprot:jgi/Bigna1/132490/aug1.17_g7198